MKKTGKGTIQRIAAAFLAFAMAVSVQAWVRWKRQSQRKILRLSIFPPLEPPKGQQ